MFKKSLILFFLFICSQTTWAQSADAVYEQYLYFNLARLKGELANAFSLGEKLLPDADKLPPKSKISFYNGMAKVYEDSNEPDKAVHYYEIVAAAEPDYYVVHRALGYLYLAPAADLYKKLSDASVDKATKDALTVQYKNIVLKALPHLEKAQACDPSDETLSLIKTLYTNINDKAGLKSLDGRLAALSKNCVTVLSDQ